MPPKGGNGGGGGGKGPSFSITGLNGDQTVVSGQGAEPGGTVTVFISLDGTNWSGTTVADGNGDWSFTLADASGYDGSVSGDYTIVAETEVPKGRNGTKTISTDPFAYTVEGNTPATFAGDLAGAATEDGTGDSGSATVTDPDAGEDGFQPLTNVNGAFGFFSISAAGNWDYVLDNTRSATQSLTAGEVQQESFTVTSVDGTTTTITIDVTGANDAAVITGDASGAVAEDGAGAENGALSATDEDAGEAAFQTQTSADGTYGTFSIDAAGNWAYTLDNTRIATQALTAGEVQQDSFTVQTIDGTSTFVVIDVTGTNDDATITGDATGAITEDDPTNIATGALSITDADAGEDVFQTQTGSAGIYGAFSIDAAGNWTYTLDNADPDTQALGAIDSETDSFTVWSADGLTSETVEITVTGADEANLPPVAVDDFYTTDEDTPVSFNFMANDFDPEGDFFGLENLAGGEGDGNFEQTDFLNNIWTFTPAQDWHGTATIFYTLTDGSGTSNQATITITVNSVEDPPTAAEDNQTTDYETAVTINLMANDFDPDGDSIDVVGVTQGASGSVALNPDGTATYTPNAGFDGDDSFTYTLEDANGNQSTGTVNVTVRPEVDTTPPPISTPDMIAASDSGLSDTDDLTNNTTPTFTGTSEEGATIELFDGSTSLGTTIAGADGAWTHTPSSPLTEGTRSITAVATDDAGNSATSDVLVITIDTGTDTPVVTEVLNEDTSTGTGGVTDDATPTIRGTAEAGATVTVRIDGIVVGIATADISGMWDVTVGLTQSLPDGTYSVTAEATDEAGNGPETSGAFAMEVDAVADPPPPPPPPPGGGSYTPDDPLYAEQWHLTRIGDLETVWADFTGANVTVGIYDNGVEEGHEDLGNYDMAWDLAAGGTEEHGTAVAGVIAASDNSVGGVGVAFNATLGGANIFDGAADINSNPSGYKSVIDQAAVFDVVSMSWGNGPDWINNDAIQSIDTVNALANAAVNGRGGKGTIAVKAAGNDVGNAAGDWINHSRHIIVVAGHDSGNDATGLAPDASWYTNRGANVLVSAPTSGNLDSGNLAIQTTDLSGSGGYNGFSDYTGTGGTGFGGTSSATPVVSGVAALMLEANDQLGWRDVQEILAYSSHRIEGDPGAFDTVLIPIIFFGIIIGYQEIETAAEFHDWFENDAYNWNGGGLSFSEDYGFGGVNAYNAVRMAEVWSYFQEEGAAPTDPGAHETSLNEAHETSGLIISGAQNTVGTETQTPLSVFFDYTGPAMSLETVDLFIEWTADQRENVTMELVSPSNTSVTLLLSAGEATGVDASKATNVGMPLGGGTTDWNFATRAFMGEDPTGQWEVRLTDMAWSAFGGLFDTLRVEQFQLDFYGELVDPEATRNDTYHYTTEILGLAGDPDRLVLDDAGGIDWLDLAAMPTNLSIDLSNGASSYADPGPSQVEIIRLAGGADIEHAVTGDGNDTITGNDLANRLGGMRGDDTLTGGGGDDWFFFEPGFGTDRLTDFNDGNDIVSLSGFAEVSWSDISGSFTTLGSETTLNLSSGDRIIFEGAPALGSADFEFDGFAVA